MFCSGMAFIKMLGTGEKSLALELAFILRQSDLSVNKNTSQPAKFEFQINDEQFS